ncbi:hypothetical protein Dcar01_03525 [Deinococcus carri]|uniref:Uncharacterized protein n=1 Tax=Deinococcus carri TaxID=1211323 RepID=A0ABP9WBR1_9DEIO
MLITISRPGALPHATYRAKTRYRDGQVAFLPAGSTFEILRGNLCGAGTLRFSAPPDFAPRDWVRVYLAGDLCLPGDPADNPRYLGEAVNEPWEAGEGDITCQALTDRIRKAAWHGDLVGGVVQPLEDFLRPYLLAVLARCGLGPVAVGDVPDYRARFRSVNPFELLGDTLDALLPALPGGVAGVDARARLQVVPDSDTVMVRFPRSRSERPPGRVDNYANCVRFKYTKPSGEEAVFEQRLTLEVAVYRQEAWAVESLPASVTTTQLNPYAGQSVRVGSAMTYPGENAGLSVYRETRLDAMNPAWTGHLGDGIAWDTAVLSGAELQLRAAGQEAYTFRTRVQAQLTTSPIPAELRLQLVAQDGTTTIYSNTTPGAATWTHTMLGASAGIMLRYHPDDLQAYRAAHGAYPTGFDLRAIPPGYSGSTPTTEDRFVMVRAAAAAVEPTNVQFVENEYIVPADAYNLRLAAPAMLLPQSASLHLPLYYQWRSGDQVVTDAHVTGVSVYDSLTTARATLTRAEDDPETGRRVWTLPADVRVDGVTVSGDPAQIGWVGLRLTDEAGLASYAHGLLRNRTQPARVWTGTIRNLDPLDVGGQARFDTPGGDMELDVQKATYHLGERQKTVECGTPWPRDDADALAGAIERVERDVRRAG